MAKWKPNDQLDGQTANPVGQKQLDSVSSTHSLHKGQVFFYSFHGFEYIFGYSFFTCSIEKLAIWKRNTNCNKLWHFVRCDIFGKNTFNSVRRIPFRIICLEMEIQMESFCWFKLKMRTFSMSLMAIKWAWDSRRGPNNKSNVYLWTSGANKSPQLWIFRLLCIIFPMGKRRTCPIV